MHYRTHLDLHEDFFWTAAAACAVDECDDYDDVDEDDVEYVDGDGAPDAADDA